MAGDSLIEQPTVAGAAAELRVDQGLATWDTPRGWEDYCDFEDTL